MRDIYHLRSMLVGSLEWIVDGMALFVGCYQMDALEEENPGDSRCGGPGAIQLLWRAICGQLTHSTTNPPPRMMAGSLMLWCS